MELPDDILIRLEQSNHWAVLTGSGVSQESGVPTFRDAQTGIWSHYRPEELATPEAFAKDPKTVWEWYQWRRELCQNAQPNDGHRALAELAQQVEHLDLITQNVDGLHQRAGSPVVIEFHGNITRNRCSACSRSPATAADRQIPPHCTDCGGLLRPDVVWFGEPIPSKALQQSEAAVRKADVFLSIGTSSLVYPAAGLATEALRRGSLVIEINPMETPLSGHAHHVIRKTSADALPRLAQLLAERAQPIRARLN